MKGIREARSACARVLGSRIEAQFMSLFVICSIVLFLTPMRAGLELVSGASQAPRAEGPGEYLPPTVCPALLNGVRPVSGRPQSNLAANASPWSPPPGFL